MTWAQVTALALLTAVAVGCATDSEPPAPDPTVRYCAHTADNGQRYYRSCDP